MSQQQQHPISDFTSAAMSNLRALVDVNTIIGDPITTGDGVVIIPVSKVTFGFGSGGSDLPNDKSDMFGGLTGGGVSIQPLAFLVINGYDVQLLHMHTADTTGDRLVNAMPGVIDKLAGFFPGKDKKTAPQQD